jgi:hypothetical protein
MIRGIHDSGRRPMVDRSRMCSAIVFRPGRPASHAIHEVTPGRPWPWRATPCRTVSHGDQIRASQPEAVKADPPCAQKAQRLRRLTLETRGRVAQRSEPAYSRWARSGRLR